MYYISEMHYAARAASTAHPLARERLELACYRFRAAPLPRRVSTMNYFTRYFSCMVYFYAARRPIAAHRAYADFSANIMQKGVANAFFYYAIRAF